MPTFAESGTARLDWRGESPHTDDDLLAAIPARLRLRHRAQEFLMAILKAGPLTARVICEAAKKHRLSVRTLDRARKDLGIRTVRTGVFTPQQTSYWLVPAQDLPEDAGISQTTRDLDAFFREQEKLFPGPTPLDRLEKP